MQGTHHSSQARKIELGTDDGQSGDSRATVEGWLNAYSSSTIEILGATESGLKSLLRASIILPVVMLAFMEQIWWFEVGRWWYSFWKGLNAVVDGAR